MKKLLRILFLSFSGLYVLYFAAVAIFLNTPLFSSVADMQDEGLTHIRFHGAFSFYPGQIWISNAKVGIRDQNVSVDILIHHATVKFDLRPLLKKTIHTTELKINEAKLNIATKSSEERVKFISQYTTEKNANLPMRIALGNKNRNTRLKFEFPKIDIVKISELQTPIGELKADMDLHGGFRIQPGVEVEVYPSVLSIRNGSLKDQFEKVNLLAKVEFKPFFIPDAPGDAVFPYVNADITLDAYTYATQALDLTLKTLTDYRFIGDKSNIRSHIQIQNGKLVPGSFFDSDPSRIGLQTPDIKAKGDGQATWKVLEHHSELLMTLKNISTEKPDSSVSKGKIETATLHLFLYGNDLVHLFHGVVSDLRLTGLQWKLGDGSSAVTGKLSGSGNILGIAGELDNTVRESWSKQHTSLKLSLDSAQMKPKNFPLITAHGKISMVAEAINFTANSIQFDQAESQLSLEVNHEKTQATLKIRDLSYLLAPNKSWKGHANLVLGDTAPFVHVLRTQEKISSWIGLFANVSDLQADVDWESGVDFSWFKVNSIHSSGIWTAYGTLMDNKKSDTGLSGLFEVKVAGLPIGIRIQNSQSDVSFLPSTNWFNESSETQLR